MRPRTEGKEKGIGPKQGELGLPSQNAVALCIVVWLRACYGPSIVKQ